MSNDRTKQSRESGTQGHPGRQLGRTGRVMLNLLRPRWVRIALVASLLLSAVVTVALHVGPAFASHKTPQDTLYGPSNAAVLAAVRAARWPQQKSIWCGVATVAAIAQFRGHAVSQQNVADYLNSDAAVSEWGTPGPSAFTFGPGFRADIAGDVGTDPRSLAASVSATAVGSYHELVDFASNYDATLHLVDDLIRAQEPISVIVFHGLHSVLVSGVTAWDNPVTDPGSITGLEVWDPGFGIFNGNIQSAQEVLVPLSTWLNSSDYWATPYNANYFGSIAEDPDPAVGPYTFDPGQNKNGHLWIGHYVYVRPDIPGELASTVSPDWAFSQNDTLIEGFQGQVPSQYTGQVTTAPTTLGDSSIDGPAFWSQSAYQLTSGSLDPATVLAWTGTDGRHHLNVETSQDGFTYQNKVVLNETSIARPSVIVVPSASGNVVVIAWTGTDSGRHLNVIYDVYGSAQKVTLVERSPYSPSLAYFGGQIWMAWTGTDGGRTLNVLALGAQGLTPGVKTTLFGNGSNAAPEVVPDTVDNLLLLAWQMSSTTNLNFMQSADGSNWAPGIPAPFAAGGPDSPAMMVINRVPPPWPAYYLCWTGWHQPLNLAASFTLTSWAIPNLYLQQPTIGPPELGFSIQYGQVLIAWTGPDKHMNVMMLPV